jgi:hypothetical protein
MGALLCRRPSAEILPAVASLAFAASEAPAVSASQRLVRPCDAPALLIGRGRGWRVPAGVLGLVFACVSPMQHVRVLPLVCVSWRCVAREDRTCNLAAWRALRPSMHPFLYREPSRWITEIGATRCSRIRSLSLPHVDGLDAACMRFHTALTELTLWTSHLQPPQLKPLSALSALRVFRFTAAIQWTDELWVFSVSSTRLVRVHLSLSGPTWLRPSRVEWAIPPSLRQLDIRGSWRIIPPPGTSAPRLTRLCYSDGACGGGIVKAAAQSLVHLDIIRPDAAFPDLGARPLPALRSLVLTSCVEPDALAVHMFPPEHLSRLEPICGALEELHIALAEPMSLAALTPFLLGLRRLHLTMPWSAPSHRLFRVIRDMRNVEYVDLQTCNLTYTQVVDRRCWPAAEFHHLGEALKRGSISWAPATERESRLRPRPHVRP